MKQARSRRTRYAGRGRTVGQTIAPTDTNLGKEIGKSPVSVAWRPGGWPTLLAPVRGLRYGVAMVAQEVIEAARQTLAAVADDPVKIVLFGSRARGDAGPDSDFDFLVVERDPRDRHAEMVRLGRALRPLGMPFDVVVVSERYADDWGAVEGTMVHAALTEGRVLHAAT